MTTPFRHSAGFGKRIEYWIIGLMLKENMDVYVPLVDDHAVDAIVRRKDGSNALVQIKARSKDISIDHAALFAAIPHKHHLDEDYWLIFYSEHMNKVWLLNSEEFIEESTPNLNGKNAGLRTIKFNGCRAERETGMKKPYVKDRYLKYVIEDFSKLAEKRT